MAAIQRVNATRPESQDAMLWARRAIKLALLITAGVGVGLMLSRGDSAKLAGRIMVATGGILLGAVWCCEGAWDIWRGLGIRRANQPALPDDVAEYADEVLGVAYQAHGQRSLYEALKGKLAAEDATQLEAQLVVISECYEQ